MGVLFWTCITLVGIASALCYPPIFVAILVICIPVIGIVPLILYLFFMSMIYAIKKGKV